MLLFQAIFDLLRRSLGNVVKAIFGWATLALFGEVREDERTLLTIVVGAAAAWPLLLVGTIFPRQAALLLAVLPIPKGTPEAVVRAVWIALTVLVPLAVGWALARKKAPSAPGGRLRALLMGFPATAGIGLAFLVACFAVPIQKLLAMARGLRVEHVPLEIEPEDYNRTVSELGKALARGGLDVAPHRPPLATRVLGRILQAFAGTVLDAYHPKDLAYLRSPGLALTVYPNGVRLLGPEKSAARAHALIAEAATASPALQCMSPDGQKLERRIKALARRHETGEALDRGIRAAARELAEEPLAFTDWEILHRELLQVIVASRGASRLIEREARKASGRGAATAGRFGRRDLARAARRARSYGRSRIAQSASDQLSRLFGGLAGRLLRLFGPRR